MPPPTKINERLYEGSLICAQAQNLSCVFIKLPFFKALFQFSQTFDDIFICFNSPLTVFSGCFLCEPDASTIWQLCPSETAKATHNSCFSPTESFQTQQKSWKGLLSRRTFSKQICSGFRQDSAVKRHSLRQLRCGQRGQCGSSRRPSRLHEADAPIQIVYLLIRAF